MSVKSAKKDKGFSLVELIIAVVILGIISIVAIGGLYRWVVTARINTDVNNAREINQNLPLVMLNSGVITDSYDTFKPTTSRPDINDGNLVVLFHWRDRATLRNEGGDLWWYGQDGVRRSTADWGCYNATASPSGQNECGRTLLEALYNTNAIEEYPESKTGGEFVMMFYFNEDGIFTHSATVCVSPDIDETKSFSHFNSSNNRWEVGNYETLVKAYQ